MAEKILAIDDEPLILTTIERALSKTGYEVTTTSNTEDFMNSLPGGFDLLIVDLHLGGINTDEFLKRVRDIVPAAKMLIISGSVPGLQGRYFLQKPFKIEELRGKVREILDEQ